MTDAERELLLEIARVMDAIARGADGNRARMKELVAEVKREMALYRTLFGDEP